MPVRLLTFGPIQALLDTAAELTARYIPQVNGYLEYSRAG